MKKGIVAILIALAIVVSIVVFGQIFNLDSVSVRFENYSEISEEEIVSKSGVSKGQNIFVLSDKNIKNNVENAYPDRSVAVTDVEKIFPNKIVITVKIRKPVFAVGVASGDEIIPTDLDFQLSKKRDANSVDTDDLITITDLKVDGTFDIEPFKIIRRASKAFLANGFTESSFTSFFKAIEYSTDKLSFVLRDFGGAKLVVSTTDSSDDAVLLEVGKLLEKFYQIPETERAGVILSL